MSSVFDQTAATEVIKTSDVNALVDLTSKLISAVKENPNYLANVTSDFYEAIISAVSGAGTNCELISKQFDFIIALMDGLTEQQKIEFTDAGIAFTVSDIISSEDVEIQKVVCSFISRSSVLSDYVSDAFFTLDIHSILIKMAVCDNEEIQNTTTDAIFHLFGNHQNILSSILLNSLPSILQLLTLSSNTAKGNIVKTLTEVTNQRSSLCPELYDHGCVKAVVEMLNDDDLIPAVLPLLGNLCLSSRADATVLLDLDVPKKVIALMKRDDYAADAFWILSNLIESVPDVFSEHEISNERVHNFIDLIIEKAAHQNLVLRREAVFFLASLIMFASRAYLQQFMRKDVFDLIVKVLEIARDDTKVRYLDVFNRFCIHVQHDDETYAKFKSLTSECGVIEQLEILKSHENEYFAQKIAMIEEDIAHLDELHGKKE